MNYLNQAPPSVRQTSRTTFSGKNSYFCVERSLAFPSHQVVPTTPYLPLSRTEPDRSVRTVSARTIAQNFALHLEEAWPGKQLTMHALLKGLRQANCSYATIAITLTPPPKVPIPLKRLHLSMSPSRPATSSLSMA